MKRTLTILTGVTGCGLTAFLTAAVLYGLFYRLGDTAGSVCAGRLAIFSAGLTVASTAAICLYIGSAMQSGSDAEA